MNHIWKIKGLLLSKRRKCKIAKGHFSKITEIARWEPPRMTVYSEHSIAIHSISKTGYVTAILAIVHPKLSAREASSFCDLWKMTSCDFTLFYYFLTQSNICFFEMCLVRTTIANLCPIMIHFNALDFNECRSEEVISFFWRSVYYFSNSPNQIMYCFWYQLIFIQLQTLFLSSEHITPNFSLQCAYVWLGNLIAEHADCIPLWSLQMSLYKSNVVSLQVVKNLFRTCICKQYFCPGLN